MATDLKTMVSDLMGRIRLAGLAGKQFGGDRDLYQVFGYKRTLTPLDFIDYYYRNPIAYRAVNAFPAATWADHPQIIEGEKREETEFEKAVDALNDSVRLMHYFERADKQAGLGRYAILILGVDDGAAPDQPLIQASALNWLKPVTEQNAEVASWEQDPTSPQFGKPKLYRVTIVSEESSTQPRKTLMFHHTRVIHIAENLGEDEVYGVPRLEPVFNNLFDLDKVVGGSAEMFWLGARNGLAFKADPDAVIDDDSAAALKDEAEEFQHQLRRILTSQGGEWKVMDSQTPDPTGNVKAQIQMIAGGLGIPQRILTGSEQGQLASGQDENNWLNRIDERRMNHCAPNIVRATLDRLIELGILPEPASGQYNVDWPDSDGTSEKDKSEIARNRSQALKNYADSLGADMIVPPTEFRSRFLGLEEEPPGGFMQEPDAMAEEGEDGGE